MQDPRVQGSFPGGVIWLRAGRAAGGRLLRMMELAVCQVGDASIGRISVTTPSQRLYHIDSSRMVLYL